MLVNVELDLAFICFTLCIYFCQSILCLLTGVSYCSNNFSSSLVLVALGAFACTQTTCSCGFSCSFPCVLSHMRKQITAFFCGPTFWLAVDVLSTGVLYYQKCD